MESMIAYSLPKQNASCKNSSRAHLQGVTIIDLIVHTSNFCGIGQDTVIYPQTVIQAGTIIGEDCVIKAPVINSLIGRVPCQFSVVVDSEVGILSD